jgi:hypothetical protein
VRGFATLLNNLKLEDLERHHAEGTLPDHEEFSITERSAKRMLAAAYIRKRDDLVQLNMDVPRPFMRRFRNFLRKRAEKETTGSVVVKALKKFMAGDLGI